MHGRHMVSAARGISGGEIEPAPPLPSARERLTSEVLAHIAQISDADLETIDSRGNLDWLGSGVGLHFSRVKKSSGCAGK
jgi:hypothetical protein